VRIYIISNGGYLLSCSLALLGYFVYRQLRPDVPRPFRLGNWAKWVALAVFIIWTVIYFFGGWNSPKIVLADPHQGPGLYLLGLFIVALYAPLYWWRRAQDRRRAGTGTPAVAVTAASALDGSGARSADPADPVAGSEASGEPPVVR
jgi:hypothetical protein